MPPAAIRVAELVGSLEQFAALVHGAAVEYEEAIDDDEELLTSMRFAIRMNTLKTSASACSSTSSDRALTICGMAGVQRGVAVLAEHSAS